MHSGVRIGILRNGVPEWHKVWAKWNATPPSSSGGHCVRLSEDMSHRVPNLLQSNQQQTHDCGGGGAHCSAPSPTRPLCPSPTFSWSSSVGHCADMVCSGPAVGRHNRVLPKWTTPGQVCALRGPENTMLYDIVLLWCLPALSLCLLCMLWILHSSDTHSLPTTGITDNTENLKGPTHRPDSNQRPTAFIGPLRCLSSDPFCGKVALKHTLKTAQ